MRLGPSTRFTNEVVRTPVSNGRIVRLEYL